MIENLQKQTTWVDYRYAILPLVKEENALWEGKHWPYLHFDLQTSRKHHMGRTIPKIVAFTEQPLSYTTALTGSSILYMS